MRVAAAVATACLLTSGCSAMVKRPSGASIVSDFAFGLSAFVIVKDQMCQPGEFCIEDKGMATVMFGVPTALVGAVAGLWALANQPADADAPPPKWDGRLPSRPTDAVTLDFARQVRVSVELGECDAARAMMELIAARDAEYHIALLAKGALGACP